MIPRTLLNQQGSTSLREAIINAPGINEGGGDDTGFFDRFLIRGLDARIYSDGFSDGDQLNGIPHSLNGVQRIEILAGPGSALFGSGPPGGTINLVHYGPSSTLHYGGAIQYGSFASFAVNQYVTGPTSVNGLNYRIDATINHADGYRNLGTADYEIRPDVTWRTGNHLVEFTLDARHLHQTPDLYGLIYLNGSPITGVPAENKYSTPFSYGDQDVVRTMLSDKWTVSDYLTVNNRFSYTHRSVNFLRNGISGVVVGNTFTHRQVRSQNDLDDTFDYQLEPVWKFDTGPAKHTLLTGFELQHLRILTNRATADVPNITNIFAPVIPETSANNLTFLRDPAHNGAFDDMQATYLSLYATDQIDLTDRLKLRLGVRQDWWTTSLNPLVFVPGRLGPNGQSLEPGSPQTRVDAPVSWNIGALYKVLPWASPYAGVARSYLANFNSENTQNGVADPENATQYEAGIKFALFDDKLIFNTAAFHITRNHVAALLGDTPIFNDQTTDGFEGSLDAQPLPGWHLLANGTVQHAMITNSPASPSSVGNVPQGVPAHIANIWTTYNFSIHGVDGFQVGAGMNYRDLNYGNITNNVWVPSYTIFNVMAGYQHKGYSAAINLRNLTDQRYFIVAGNSGATVGEPLTIRATLRADF